MIKKGYLKRVAFLATEYPGWVILVEKHKKGEIQMKLSPPKQSTFWVATILAVLGLVGQLVSLPFVSQHAFWFVVVGFVVLWLGNYVKGF